MKDTDLSVGFAKVPQSGRGSDEPPPARKLPRPRRVEAQTPAPPKRPYPGPQGHMGPQTGFTGSAFGMRSNLVGGCFAQNGPQDREHPLLGVFGPLRAPNRAREISPSPTSKSRIAKVAVVRELRNANAVPMSQRFPEKSPLAPSHGQRASSEGGGGGGQHAHLPPAKT